MSDTTVAKWLYDEIINGGWVYQDVVVIKIKAQFGNDYVYYNENGNLAISKPVLKEFKKLKDGVINGEIVWDRSERAWKLKK